ncbi:hypothetical protein PQU92_11255 [Asticcacaulis sp. BYS171W]|uniref:Uncharacterized protein n=1 Tax=Asticcacaulis aquaticus TaxID=2984212 RepID=A0ABT5HV83_9CAUL|nr:hypothetical protein [Asticcacaulis aquaticus]MDC7683858.1 hypothetical protein [Asticcacaulis aquaticus]
MTDTPTRFDAPKFPTPEEIKAASERLTHFWVGACSPLWVPFFAATSFGVSTWMMSSALTKNVADNDLYKDLPKGFVDMMALRHRWFQAADEGAHVLEDVGDAVKEAAAAPVTMVLEAEAAVIESLKETAPVVAEAVETAQAVVEETVAETSEVVETAIVESVEAQDVVAETAEPVVEAVAESVEDTIAAPETTIPDDLPEFVVEPAFEPVPVVKALPKRRPAPKK